MFKSTTRFRPQRRFKIQPRAALWGQSDRYFIRAA